MRIEHVDTPVLVLRLDHYGALGVMRSLGRLGVPVHGLHWDSHSGPHASSDAPALRSRYARGGYAWDLDGAPPLESIARLHEIAHELGGRPVLLPTNDESALFVAAHADALRPAFRFAESSAELTRALYDKRSMQVLARELGLPTAETVLPRSLDEVRAFCERARFPILLKGADGIRLARRARCKMVIAHSARELIALYQALEDPARPDLMLQEYIPGGEDAQWMFNGYFDARSECRFGITGRKLRQTPVYTGMTSLGECRRNPEVEALTLRLVRGLGYRGVLDIGFRFDARDGRYKVLDVNPRLGATFRLFVGARGLDVARALYLDLTGQEIPPDEPVEGRRWLVEDFDLASSVRYHGDGRLGLGEWLRSFRGVRELAWFARDDLRPFADMCVRFATTCARHARKRLSPTSREREPEREPERERSPSDDPVHDHTHDQRSAQHREQVVRHFDARARDWQRIYHEDQLQPLIYQARHAAALRWAESVAPPDAHVLEVGCGPGHTAVSLAARGYRVQALDAAGEMVALAEAAARRSGVPHFRAEVGDAHALRFADGSFDLVLALGLLPWLGSEALALSEMTRVLKRGGWLIATADNPAPLHRLLDPRSTPALRPARAALKRALGRRPEPDPYPRAKTHDAQAFADLVRAAGLTEVERASVGFGPFSLFGRPLLPDRASRALHRHLQSLADRRWPLLRSTGAHHLLLARK